MSQLDDQSPFPAAPPSPGSGPPGMSIASVIVSGLGICLPGAGLLGILFGTIGFIQSRARRVGSGVAIAGVALGIVTTLAWALVTMLIIAPAFAGGLEGGRRFVSAGYGVMIREAIAAQAAPGTGEYPPPGSDFESLIGNEVPSNVWTAPFDGANAHPSFLLVYESTDPPYAPRWIILNPDITEAKLIPMIDFATADVEMVEPGEVVRLIGDSMLYTTDGRLWRLTGPS